MFKLSSDQVWQRLPFCKGMQKTVKPEWNASARQEAAINPSKSQNVTTAVNLEERKDCLGDVVNAKVYGIAPTSVKRNIGPNTKGYVKQFVICLKHRAPLSHRAPVAQLVEHRAVMREVVSSTLAGPTLRVFK